MPAEARTAGGSGLGPGSVRTGVSGDDAAHSPAPDPQVVHAAVEQPARAGDTPGEPPIWRCTHDQPIERRHTPCQPRIGPNISRRSPRMLDQRGESVAGLDDAAPDSYSPSPEQWSSGLGGTGCASWRLDQLENIPWQTAAYVLTAGGSPPECDAALGLHPPATLSRELRSWADKTPRLTDAEQYRQITLRRDPPPVKVIGRPPGETSCTSPVRAVLVRSSRCWRRFHHGPGRVAAALGPAPRAARNPHPPTTRRRAQRRQARQLRGRGLTSTANERIFTPVHFTPLVIRHRTPR
jgi:hypothetical protein